MLNPHYLFPGLLSFLLLLGICGAGECSQKEDFQFLNRTVEEAKLVSSWEDLVESYSVFFLSTLISFEARYWGLEILRKKFNSGSELSSYSPEIVEIASIWTAACAIRSDKYTDWPRNEALHYCVKFGGGLETVIAGVLLARGGVTAPALFLIFVSAESLAEMITGTVTTSILRRINVDPNHISPAQYDVGESTLSSIAIGWSMGFTVFEVLTLTQMSPIKSVAACSAVAALSATAVEAVTYINGLNVQLSDVAVAVAVAGVRALLILVKVSPISNTRYSRIAATTTVASIFALVSSIANYLNRGVPLDETFSEISWLYWEKPYKNIHTAMDYLWTAFNSQ